MGQVFRITPKRIKRVNGQVLTPEMSVIVTSPTRVTMPWNNIVLPLIKEQYRRYYGFDYDRSGCSPFDFTYQSLD